MNDETLDELEPVNTGDLFVEFSDTPLAELLLTIKDLREQLEHERKVCAAKEFKLSKAEEELELLHNRINTGITALSGEEPATEPKDE